MMAYDPHRRSPRVHKRVVRKGNERFDVDGVEPDPSDRRPQGSKQRDDDNRILRELPPHWGIFSERDK
ncbi:hypothetical protein OZX73_07215 [Bifidobacterium sp. ESL0775]|uniref:hypothetical protein n=1 Tax=Bifidobacterium sp. ESL0775 TaxID=2983230 RepID=UPI0023F7569D|nr:hypothetical protein [Bifidobacterium sp. ESL0775]WEV70132.1 hypothetical protein OZX73_07215 [Bifidobacterium sp. ESL0775]